MRRSRRRLCCEAALSGLAPVSRRAAGVLILQADRVCAIVAAGRWFDADQCSCGRSVEDMQSWAPKRSGDVIDVFANRTEAGRLLAHELLALKLIDPVAVSYTHLTLPTIYSV